MLNALSFNIEKKSVPAGVDDYVVEATNKRIIQNTQRTLDILARYDAPATFFIRASEAETNGQLVRMIDQSGHEIACQGSLEPDSPDAENFRSSLRNSKAILDQQSSREIQGFRAPDFSIHADSLWALDVLIEEGFQYDASMVPAVINDQAINAEQRFPHKIDREEERSIIEVPLSTTCFFGKPRALGDGNNKYRPTFTRWGYQRIHRKEKRPFIHTLNIWRMEESAAQSQLERLLNQYRFTSIRNLLRNLHLLN